MPTLSFQYRTFAARLARRGTIYRHLCLIVCLIGLSIVLISQWSNVMTHYFGCRMRYRASLQSRTPAARLARSGRYHSQVHEEWSASVPERTQRCLPSRGELGYLPGAPGGRPAPTHAVLSTAFITRGRRLPTNRLPSKGSSIVWAAPRPAGPSWAGLGP